jgi:hypothetical protein
MWFWRINDMIELVLTPIPNFIKILSAILQLHAKRNFAANCGDWLTLFCQWGAQWKCARCTNACWLQAIRKALNGIAISVSAVPSDKQAIKPLACPWRQTHGFNYTSYLYTLFVLSQRIKASFIRHMLGPQLSDLLIFLNVVIPQNQNVSRAVICIYINRVVRSDTIQLTN